MKLTSLLQLADCLQQAGKIDKVQTSLLSVAFFAV